MRSALARHRRLLVAVAIVMAAMVPAASALEAGHGECAGSSDAHCVLAVLEVLPPTLPVLVGLLTPGRSLVRPPLVVMPVFKVPLPA